MDSIAIKHIIDECLTADEISALYNVPTDTACMVEEYAEQIYYERNASDVNEANIYKWQGIIENLLTDF